MKAKTKMSATKRQQLIIERLKETNTPITGSEFAKLANVSRQVIVQDVSLLKAKNIPIVATSQGYILVNNEGDKNKFHRVIVCKHTPEQTETELNILVDHGVTVKNVVVEHAVYGELTASIMVSNRAEVEAFVKKIKNANAAYLLSLTEGIHYHTLEADSKDKIEMACKELKKAGFLVE